MVCGRAVYPDMQFCSPDCKEKYELSKEREKRTRIMIMVIYAVLVVVMILLFVFMPRTP